MPQIEIRLIVLQPSYCAEIQICFNEHRSFAVILGTQTQPSRSRSPGVFSPKIQHSFHNSFSIHVSNTELPMVGNFEHVKKLQPDSRFPLCLLSVSYYHFSAI